MPLPRPAFLKSTALALSLALSATVVATVPAAAQDIEIRLTPFHQAVAEAAARDEDLAAFYRERGFEGVWLGDEAASHRAAFFAAMEDAHVHGLPEARFDPYAVMSMLENARTADALGRAEVEMSRIFLDFAREMENGVLIPSRVNNLIKREVLYTPRREQLEGYFANAPVGYLRQLAPNSPEYQRLLRVKMQMEQQLRDGGYGPGVTASLREGSVGVQVVHLRNRLMAMGFLDRTVTTTFDTQMKEAVMAFQSSIGLNPDGVVGGATLSALNVPLEDRLKQVLVAMERERWMNNLERGQRHVWVNLTDFTAAIVDDDHVTFRTRSVIGAHALSRQTPEFSDTMEHMVINPYWYVPRSIINGEYGGRVPAGFEAVNYRGQIVNTRDASNVSVRQRPGPGNALGRVKFMFPNSYNIYLHDTPSQHLFANPVRAYSHGCIRLDDPYDFAYELLRVQEDDPVGFFQSRLNSGANTHVPLDQPVPVHLIYRTAFTNADGLMNYRNDIYGRDAEVWNALAAAGVAIGAVGG
ncbi:L,D-transpeptidase family protein [Pelagovum pacificum]|uniref:Murein L,D-transpeptidase n=1 Tax=Pelagovum pacificum TaxID=2588711 RepID=A0A5C5GEI8_9RHOB|nr:L,D-transpeptidase family protein [Pelagovum pacificum]QQA41166.1 L,D-transpeptidase family protein [Pelagovum pacificum]TNY32026.1 murein L,D-transpeptidase [Pelagovum pacificum]